VITTIQVNGKINGFSRENLNVKEFDDKIPEKSSTKNIFNHALYLC